MGMNNMNALLDHDLVIGRLVGDGTGVPIPEELQAHPFGQLRFDGENLIDAATIPTWLIDEFKRKRLPVMHPGSDWQTLDCNWDAPLVKDNITGDWRLETDADQLAGAKTAAIIGAVQAANSFTASVLDKYPEAERAAWPQKQAECAIIIAADDASTSIVTALGKTTLMATIANAAGWDNAATVVAARAIITKANEFAAIAAMVEVMREQAGTAIAAATDIEALEIAKTDLMQQASTLAAQYGLS